ncbi:hypothetical protein RHOFW510R12_09465 [Rhodanobacter sp. FW510-R12]|uniref:hypothetical protein n=1 Tax=unclassified Rhodanobacter TaxID=2621553 RepID=UPI0007AA174E|nr:MULTISPECIES: hypothetical protein [unclassified Rhodanobacter]KZC16222.1 hypothetical protein RHOFW104R8_00860 [Rhodanobacter sp. FW104-R8]KZC26411.1 hypothetical protein RhoFW510T8_02415 [Rhodanobacter sp. FW510-T8]KZC30255.1 hypothetical protein RhoFW510R10_02840 [Rhodanobacter sp. FW510-R10]
MGHNKSRSSVSVGPVDWSDPSLDALLQKVDGWQLDNRSSQSPQDVQIHVNSGWTAGSVVSKPAQLISMDEQTMVLATRFPVPQGEHVRVDTRRADGVHTVWAWMVEGREGCRVEDREHGLFLSKLRIG